MAATAKAQLAVTLFDRTPTSTPRLTEAGRVVVAEARLALGCVRDLRAKAAGMLQDLEYEPSTSRAAP